MSEVSYEENTDTSVNIIWKPPEEPNGVIVAYFVEHGVYQNESTRSLGIDAIQNMSAVIQALSKLLPLHNLMNSVCASLNCSHKINILPEFVYASVILPSTRLLH